jgi:hypothetical protein
MHFGGATLCLKCCLAADNTLSTSGSRCDGDEANDARSRYGDFNRFRQALINHYRYVWSAVRPADHPATCGRVGDAHARLCGGRTKPA